MGVAQGGNTELGKQKEEKEGKLVMLPLNMADDPKWGRSGRANAKGFPILNRRITPREGMRT